MQLGNVLAGAEGGAPSRGTLELVECCCDNQQQQQIAASGVNPSPYAHQVFLILLLVAIAVDVVLSATDTNPG